MVGVDQVWYLAKDTWSNAYCAEEKLARLKRYPKDRSICVGKREQDKTCFPKSLIYKL